MQKKQTMMFFKGTNMKTIYFLLLIITLISNVFGQDIDLSNAPKDDTSTDEFELDTNETKVSNAKHEIFKSTFKFSDEKKPRPTRRGKTIALDSTRPSLISLQFGPAFDFFKAFGSHCSITYERKINNRPIAWFANYTFGRAFDYNDEDFEEKKEIISYNHFGGGMHYYFGYDRLFKPYVGVGGFTGFNQFKKDLGADGTSDSHGLDFGGYGLIGIRWCYGHVKCGFEYRLGYMQGEIMNKNVNSGFQELSFLLGFQF